MSGIHERLPALALGPLRFLRCHCRECFPPLTACDQCHGPVIRQLSLKVARTVELAGRFVTTRGLDSVEHFPQNTAFNPERGSLANDSDSKNRIRIATSYLQSATVNVHGERFGKQCTHRRVKGAEMYGWEQVEPQGRRPFQQSVAKEHRILAMRHPQSFLDHMLCNLVEPDRQAGVEAAV